MRRWLRRQAARAGLVLIAGVLSINMSVRWLGGGAPHPLSVRFMPDKLTALGLLFEHYASHLAVRHPSPKSLIRHYSKKHGVPENFVLAVARTESEMMPHRISHAGAMGVMQLMPGTAAELGVEDPFDSRQNIDGAVRYLKMLWIRYDGDRHRVAAAYNAGPGRVPTVGALVGLPHETRRYVRRVCGSSVPTAPKPG